MKTFAAVAVLCLLATVQAARPRREEAAYSTQHDNVNLQEILHNDRLFNGYAACLLGKGPCTPDAQQLKDALPDALRNECSKCSEKQKEGVKITVPFLIKEKPEIWAQLKKEHDPDGKYEARYSHYLTDEKKA